MPAPADLRFPSIDGLRAFEAAERLGSFERAAEELAISASAVSKRVSTLEDLLATTLLQRSGKALALTAAGKEYLGQVRAALGLLAAMPLHQRPAQRLQRLRVTTPPTFARQILVPGLESFTRAYPGIELELLLSIPYLESTPHDSGAPIPVSFLAVPAKSDFDFHVVCHPSRLPESLQNTWRDLLQKAFDHAFEWVGFGAKTSVGYGAMKAAASASSSSVLSTSGSLGLNVQPAIGGAIANGLQTWPAATLKLNPGKNEITASFEGKTTAPVKGSDADKLRVALGEERAGRLKKKQELKGVSVEVEQQGNAFTLKGLAAT